MPDGMSAPAPGGTPAGELSGVHVPLLAAANRLGGYRWVEQRAFGLLGGWAVTTDDPALQRLFDRHSGEHGWHAQLWAERLPVLDPVDPEALVRPPSPGAVALFDALDDLPSAEGPESGILRLAGAYRVLLPRLVAGYRRHLRDAVPVSEAPVIRSLRLVLTDEVEAWCEGEMHLQQRLAGPRAAAAGAFAQHLESLVAAGGAVVGLAPEPGA